MLPSALLLAVGCGAPQTSQPEAAPGDGAVEGAAVEAVPTEVPPEAAAPTTLTIATDAGDLAVTPVYHGTVRLEHEGVVVWVDPWSKANLDNGPAADVIVITDVHFDHLDPDAIGKVAKEGTVFVAPKAVADDAKMAGHTVQHVLANGQSATIGAMTIEAVPMYNVERGPEEGGVFHEKGRGNGYVFSVGGKRVYIAGDTECTDEMKALTGIDHALIPMNLPYTMPPQEAADCVKAFKPAAVTPIHYAGSDLGVFEAALADTAGVSVVQVDAYPGGQPW